MLQNVLIDIVSSKGNRIYNLQYLIPVTILITIYLFYFEIADIRLVGSLLIILSLIPVLLKYLEPSERLWILIIGRNVKRIEKKLSNYYQEEKKRQYSYFKGLSVIDDRGFDHPPDDPYDDDYIEFLELQSRDTVGLSEIDQKVFEKSSSALKIERQKYFYKNKHLQELSRILIEDLVFYTYLLTSFMFFFLVNILIEIYSITSQSKDDWSFLGFSLISEFSLICIMIIIIYFNFRHRQLTIKVNTLKEIIDHLDSLKSLEEKGDIQLNENFIDNSLTLLNKSVKDDNWNMINSLLQRLEKLKKIGKLKEAERKHTKILKDQDKVNNK
ncbi:MAG: hypothetical protein HeimC3_23540 [Candidatus Heimdallarchaeota archaeon LC_3]|nr:MAG: hypothetical protein HeimC3_23540 [Candidatus Heimdallarchaeota archaeon LC_3]